MLLLINDLNFGGYSVGFWVRKSTKGGGFIGVYSYLGGCDSEQVI